MQSIMKDIDHVSAFYSAVTLPLVKKVYCFQGVSQSLE